MNHHANGEPIPVILDTDIGSDVDDTWALAMLLRCPELDLKMVLNSTGDTTYRATITARLLEIAGRTDVEVAIGPYAGSSNEEDLHRHQLPWVQDYDLDAYPGTVHEDGIRAMIDCILASPVPVTIIAICASSNIARALEMEPRIAEKCRFVGMHGSIDVGYGGGGDPCPETNVRLDVPALRAVFAAPWRELLITPLDTCGIVVLDGERYQRVSTSDDPLAKAVIENYRIWAPLVPWMTVDYEERKSTALFDTVAVYLAYARDLVEIEPMRLAITDDGMTVRDPDGDEVAVAIRWKDLDGFHDHLVQRLLPPR